MLKALISGIALCLAWTSAASATVTYFAAPPYPLAPTQTVGTTTLFSQQYGVTSSGDAYIGAGLFDQYNHGNPGQFSASGTPFAFSQPNGGVRGELDVTNLSGMQRMGLLVLEFTLTTDAASTLNMFALDGTGHNWGSTTNLVQGANTLYFLAQPQTVITHLTFISPTDNLVSVSNIQVTTSPTPEPASWTLLILGFGAVGFAMRRRRQAFGAA